MWGRGKEDPIGEAIVKGAGPLRGWSEVWVASPNLTRSGFPVPPNAILGSRLAADCQRARTHGCEEGFPRPRRGNGVLRPPARSPPDLRGRRSCAPCAMGANEDQEVRTLDCTPLSRRRSQRWGTRDSSPVLCVESPHSLASRVSHVGGSTARRQHRSAVRPASMNGSRATQPLAPLVFLQPRGYPQIS